MPLWERIEVTAAVRKAVVDAMSVRDPDAPVVVDGKGKPVADPQLRTNEQVPFREEVAEYMEAHVLPFAPDAWPDTSKNRIGYEIPIVKLFFKPTLTRPLEEVEEDITAARTELLLALGEASG